MPLLSGQVLYEGVTLASELQVVGKCSSRDQSLVGMQGVTSCSQLEVWCERRHKGRCDMEGVSQCHVVF